MKKYIIKIALFSLLFAASQNLPAQGPPNPPGDPSLQGPPVGGSAPIGGGIEIMLLLGFAYGSKKTYEHWKKDNEELED